MIMLLCLACGGADDDSSTPDETSGPHLEIRVYTPEPPKVTRGDIGDTSADDDEKAIKSLSIWVFESSSGNLVGYLNPADLPTTEAKVYRITVSEEFANNRPEVDIYVMANVSAANTGISLNRSSTRAELISAGIKLDATSNTDYFGLTSVVKTVPDAGLPMSGVLKNQPVDGIAPIVKVSTNVKLVRAVSKIRFVFSNSAPDDSQDLKITKIDIDAEMIPNTEYLFLKEPYTGRNFNVTDGYNSVVKTIFNGPYPVVKNSAAAEYAYTNQTGQEYETKIQEGIDDGKMTEIGKCYLRESDKIVTGKVYYTIGGVTKKPETFTMSDAGDFSRNHSWIVFGYFAGKDNLKIYNVKVTDWISTSDNHGVYNW